MATETAAALFPNAAVIVQVRHGTSTFFLPLASRLRRSLILNRDKQEKKRNSLTETVKDCVNTGF
jgi:hypothetical protein